MTDTYLPVLESSLLQTVEISLHASLIIAVLLIARPLLKRMLAPRWVYALWFIVVIRMLLIELPSLPAPTDPAIRHSLATLDAIRGENERLPVLVPIATPAMHLDGWCIASLAWVAGLGAMLVVAGIGHVRWARRLSRESTPPIPEIVDLVNEIRAEMQAGNVRVVQISSHASPFVVGLFRPTIVLPEDLAGQFSAEEFRWIVRHELAHLKRGDLWTQALCQVLQAIHWFNPLVWLGFACLRRDRELACDAYVMDQQPAAPHGYGHALIKVAETYPRPLLSPSFLGVAEESADLQERVQKISGHRRPAKLWIAISGFLCLMLAALFLLRQGESPHDATAKIQINQSLNGVPAEVEIIQSESVVVPAITNLGLDKIWAKRDGSSESALTPAEVMDRVGRILSVTSLDLPDRIVYITVKANPPVEAAQIANAIVAEYRRQVNAANLQYIIDDVRRNNQTYLENAQRNYEHCQDQLKSMTVDSAHPFPQADLDNQKAEVEKAKAGIESVNERIEKGIASSRADREANDVRILANAY